MGTLRAFGNPGHPPSAARCPRLARCGLVLLVLLAASPPVYAQAAAAERAKAEEPTPGRPLPPAEERARYRIYESFERRFEPVIGPLENTIGQLPSGWSHASTGGVRIRFNETYEGPYEGVKALRVQVPSVGGGGRGQLEYAPVPLKRGEVLRLGLALRGLPDSEIIVGLRSGSDATKQYFSQRIRPTAAWADGQLVFESTVEDENAVFFIALEKPGAVEIDRLTLQPFSGTRMLALGAEDQSPNLLPSSSFPDGVHAPWVALDAEIAETDPGVIGPSGVVALRLQGDGASLSVPFDSEGPGNYTFSLFLRGAVSEQPASLIVSPPSGNPLVYPFNQTVFPETEWRRFVATIPVQNNLDGYLLARIVVHGDNALWIDGMQVEKSDRMSLFSRTGPAELILQPVNPYGLAFENEPLGLRVSIIGDVGQVARVEGQLFDLEENAYPTGALPVKSTRAVRKTLVLKQRGEPDFGSYRVELRAYDAAGAPVSRPAEILLHRIRVPVKHDEPLVRSPFGIRFGRIEADAKSLGVARAIGFKWVRDQHAFAWRRLAPDPETWNFDPADRAAELYAGYQMNVVGVVGPAPEWAVDQPPGLPVNLPLIPRDRASWEAAVGRIVERYGDRVKWWEPWPQPYGEETIAALSLEPKPDDPDAVNIQAQRGGPEDYVALLRALQAAAGVAGRDVRVLAPVDLSGERVYTRQVIAEGLLDAAPVGIFAGGFPAGSTRQGLVDAMGWFSAQSRGKPLWWSELQPSEPWLLSSYRHVPPWESDPSPRTAAREAVRLYLEAMSAGVEKVFVPGFAVDAFKDLWLPSVRIFNVDGRLNATAPAISALAWHIESRPFREFGTIAEAIELYSFFDRETTVAVAFPRREARMLLQELPDGLVARGLFGNVLEAPFEIGPDPVYFQSEDFTPPQLQFFLREQAAEGIALSESLRAEEEARQVAAAREQARMRRSSGVAPPRETDDDGRTPEQRAALAAARQRLAGLDGRSAEEVVTDRMARLKAQLDAKSRGPSPVASGETLAPGQVYDELFEGPDPLSGEAAREGERVMEAAAVVQSMTASAESARPQSASPEARPGRKNPSALEAAAARLAEEIAGEPEAEESIVAKPENRPPSSGGSARTREVTYSSRDAHPPEETGPKRRAWELEEPSVSPIDAEGRIRAPGGGGGSGEPMVAVVEEARSAEDEAGLAESAGIEPDSARGETDSARVMPGPPIAESGEAKPGVVAAPERSRPQPQPEPELEPEATTPAPRAEGVAERRIGRPQRPEADEAPSAPVEEPLAEVTAEIGAGDTPEPEPPVVEVVPPPPAAFPESTPPLELGELGWVGFWRLELERGRPVLVELHKDRSVSVSWVNTPHGFEPRAGTWEGVEPNVRILWDDGAAALLQPASDKGFVYAEFPTQDPQRVPPRHVSTARYATADAVAVWKPVMIEEFEGEELDETRWTPTLPAPWSTLPTGSGFSPENVWLDTGRAILAAKDEPIRVSGLTRQYQGAALTTFGRFAHRFGYFEIRCIMPHGRGLHTRFRLLSEEAPYEITVFEVLGQQSDQIRFHARGPAGISLNPEFSESWTGTDFSLSYSDIGVKWLPRMMIFYVDGVERARYAGNIPDVSLSLAVELLVGSESSGPVSGWTNFPSYMLIDRIRVWELAEPEAPAAAAPAVP